MEETDRILDETRVAGPRMLDLAEDEKPREKLRSKGVGALTDAELLALFFRTGTKGMNAIELGRHLIRQYGSLNALSRCSLADYQREPGIGPAKASELTAIFEMASRLAGERLDAAQIDSPESVYELVGPDLRARDREVIRVLILNTRHKLIKAEDISVGSVSECIAHPREILKPVLQHSASAFVLTHNHPSGDPSPSEADRRLTRRLVEAANVMQIEFLDHVIVGIPAEGQEPYFSFKECGMM